MASALTEITEITTALGTLAPDLDTAIAVRPGPLHHVSDLVWSGLVDRYRSGEHADAFATAFANGQAFLWADDGLRGRAPKLVEWRGPHRPPGDDVVPADIRIDHVYQLSCKYLSRITQNCGPARLFDRLLVGEERTGGDWFEQVAPVEYQAFYDVIRDRIGWHLPRAVVDLRRDDRRTIKELLRARTLPIEAQPRWQELCAAVSENSATRWRAGLDTTRKQLRLLWRLCRIGDAPYFVLGADKRNHLRLRVASAWDWVQDFELVRFEVAPRLAGQPEVGWHAKVGVRSSAEVIEVRGHVEVRWSHGRFGGSPEAKVYLDTHHVDVPGYFPL